MRVTPHQPAGKISVGNEQQSRRQFISFGRDNVRLDLAMIAGQPDPIARAQSQPFHILGRDLQRVSFLLVTLTELPLADANTLSARPARDQNKRFRHTFVAAGGGRLESGLDSPPCNIRVNFYSGSNGGDRLARIFHPLLLRNG